MSVFTKIVTSVFGRKSDRDMKILTPYIDKINSIYNEDFKGFKISNQCTTPAVRNSLHPTNIHENSIPS